MKKLTVALLLAATITAATVGAAFAQPGPPADPACQNVPAPAQDNAAVDFGGFCFLPPTP